MASPQVPRAARTAGPERDAAAPPRRTERYTRQLTLPGFTSASQERLAAARVLLVGAGALSCACAPYLVSTGVGTVGIVDDDVVELSNLHRQVAHGTADLGRAKAESLAESLRALDPAVRLRTHHTRLTAANARELLADYDLVLDGSDNFPTRYLVADAAELAGIPDVWGAVLRYGGQVGVSFGPHEPGYRDLFPAPPRPDEVLSCVSGGVLPGVCAVVGSLMSVQAVALLTGLGEPLLGRVTSYDALTGRFRELEYRRNPEREPVTGLIDYELFCGLTRGDDVPGDAIEASDLARMLGDDEPVQLIDVREPQEWEIARIDGAELLPLGELPALLERVRGDAPVVVYCHHDTRSRQAAAMLRREGRDDVRWLVGGIDAYARTVDTTLARY